MLVAADRHGQDDGLVQAHQELQVHPVAGRLVSARLGEALHVEQREGATLQHLLNVGPLGDAEDDLLLGHRLSEPVVQERRDGGGPAAEVVLLEDDVPGP